MSALTARIPNSWNELLFGSSDIYIKTLDFDLNGKTAIVEAHFPNINKTVFYYLKAGEHIQYPSLRYLYHHFFMCVLMHANNITVVNTVLINDQNLNEDQLYALSMINVLHENSNLNSFRAILIFQSELNSGFEAVTF